MRNMKYLQGPLHAVVICYTRYPNKKENLHSTLSLRHSNDTRSPFWQAMQGGVWHPPNMSPSRHKIRLTYA